MGHGAQVTSFGAILCAVCGNSCACSRVEPCQQGKGKLGSLFVFTRGGASATPAAVVPDITPTHPAVLLGIALAVAAAFWAVKQVAVRAGASLGPWGGPLTWVVVALVLVRSLTADA